MSKRRGFAVSFFLAGALLASSGSPQDSFSIRESYVKSEHRIPMRDGCKLFTIVYAPKDASQRHPFLVHRTPYGSGPYGPETYRNSLGPTKDFAPSGYLFVYQDVRGQFQSEGEFVVMRPIAQPRTKPTDTDESTDLYDTVEWLLANVPNNNGRVGQWGVSYPGSQTVWGMIDAHPAVRASSPQAPAIDMFIGDDFHHNGAFRLMYTFNWLSGSARVRQGTTEKGRGAFDYGTPDGYRFFLDLGGVANVDKRYFHEQVPTWNEYMQHPDYDAYWERQNPLQHLKGIRHAVLNVAGWFDAEDFYGPIETYQTIEKLNPSNGSTLVAGPWLHGGWGSMPGDALGDIRFGSTTGEYFRDKVEFPWFEHLLKDKPDPRLPEALVFETGANTWRSLDRWPPERAAAAPLYLEAGGKLAWRAPQAAEGSDSFTSDPAKPVPWSAEIRTTQGHTWMVEDQRFAASRPDVLVWQTEPLDRDVTVAGPIRASLWISTTGTDADWIVKLIDVYPPNAPDNTPNPRGVRMGDYQMLLAGEVFRSKYRASYARPEPLVAGQPTRIEFSLRDRYHTFQRGHRIMVQVQSTWFPVIDRNPQKFMNIYRAADTDFQKALHTVHRSAKLPSALLLPLLR